MPPRTNLAVKPQQPPAVVQLGRRLKLVKQAAMEPAEPSPMVSAIRQYLDSLP